MDNKPVCKLIGTDGNAFAIIGKVIRTLKQANMPEKAKEFQEKATQSESCDALLSLTMDYVDVE